jgi:hypothetical protein
MKFCMFQNINEMKGGGGGLLKRSVLLSHTGFHSQIVLTKNMGNYFEFCQEKVSVTCFNNSRDTENNILRNSIYFETHDTNMYLKWPPEFSMQFILESAAHTQVAQVT